MYRFVLSSDKLVHKSNTQMLVCVDCMFKKIQPIAFVMSLQCTEFSFLLRNIDKILSILNMSQRKPNLVGKATVSVYILISNYHSQALGK